jgi:hypothetical protein
MNVEGTWKKGLFGLSFGTGNRQEIVEYFLRGKEEWL